MSDELTSKVGFNQGGQAGQPDQTGAASQAEPQGSTEEPKFVTRDEFNRMKQDLERHAQGLIDKNVSRLDRRVSEATEKVNDTIRLVKEAGMQLTPEQETQLREKVINKALMEPDTSQPNASRQSPEQRSGASPAQAGAGAGEQTDPATQWAENLLKATGMPEDAPELSMVDVETTDVNAYRKSVLAAAQAYADRIAKPAGSPASVPGASGRGTGGSNLTDKYIQEMRAAAGQGFNAGRAIREKYRKQGVDVDNIGWR